MEKPAYLHLKNIFRTFIYTDKSFKTIQTNSVGNLFSPTSGKLERKEMGNYLKDGGKSIRSECNTIL